MWYFLWKGGETNEKSISFTVDVNNLYTLL